MACSSPSVESVADKSNQAQKAIDDLQTNLKSKDKENNDYFNELISKNLEDSKISDARVINSGTNIKTEYISEFNLDKITDVIINTLKVIEKTITSSKIPLGALDSYLDLINAISESAKSSSSVVQSNSFSMTRMSPGLFVFLYSVSLSIKDSDLFGNESVCSTAIYYEIIESIDDIKNESKVEIAAIDRENILKMKKLQAALLDDLSNNLIDAKTWDKKDTEYSKLIDKIQKRLDGYHFDETDSVKFENLTINNDMSEYVESMIGKLKTMDGDFSLALMRTKERIKTSYYL